LLAQEILENVSVVADANCTNDFIGCINDWGGKNDFCSIIRVDEKSNGGKERLPEIERILKIIFLGLVCADSWAVTVVYNSPIFVQNAIGF
jgi:hypothetical protein